MSADLRDPVVHTRKKVVRGSMWLLGTQGAGFILQFAYAAATARLVGVGDFGSYAIAIASVGIVNILSNAGIGQSVLRTAELLRSEYRSLASLSLFVGGCAAVAVILTAGPWSAIWGGGSSAIDPIRWLSLSCFVAPFIGYTSAVLRREGMFKQIAISQLLCNFLGMAIGLAFVFEFRNASSLVGNLIVTQLLLVGYLSYKCGRRALPGTVGRSSFPHLVFSGKVTLTNLLYYVQQNLPKMTISRFLGPETLGLWNRAEVLTAVPFQAVQVALLQTIYPEFKRFSHDVNLARKKWTAMLVWSAAFSIPAGCLLSATVPTLVLVMYGEEWSGAGQIAAWLVLACCVVPTTSLLAAGLEAISDFGAIYWSQVVCIIVEVLFLVAVVSFRSALLAVLAFGVSLVLRHILQLIAAGRLGLVNMRTIVCVYCASGLVGCVVYLASLQLLNVCADLGWPPFLGLAFVSVLFVSVILLIAVAVKLSPFSRRLIQIVARFVG